MTFFWQSLTLFEILKQRRKHPHFVCFISVATDFYLFFSKSETIVSFTNWTQVFVWPTLQVTPPLLLSDCSGVLHPPLASQHTAHLLVSLHSHLRAETFKSGSSSGSVTERERFCDNCLPVRVLTVRCHVGTLSKLTTTLQRCVYLVSHMPLTSR